MTDTLYPMVLTPTLHIKVWGGRKLQQEMGKLLPGDSPYGESWEVHDSCTVANGPYAGQDLSDVIAEHGTDIVGAGFDPADGLPLLVKLLDATAWLSVQVHPDDAQAKELEGDPRGKTEAWVMLVTEPDAQLVIGVEPGTSREAMAEAIRNGTIEDLLVMAQVEAGDVLYMPANTVHAIGPGILLYEVQQSSNVTYRLYDWGRVGLDGLPRELHIDKGVQVANLDELPEITHPEDDLIVDGDYFSTLRHRLSATPISLSSAGAFQALTCIEGKATISHAVQTVTIESGQSALIPAAAGVFELSGDGIVLRSFMK